MKTNTGTSLPTSFASWIPEPIRPTLRRMWRLLSGRPLDALDITGGVVAGGPFCGMRYEPLSIGSVLSAKLLGTYERELHPWLNEILSTPYRRIHVIGCAEGYYAVGLARSLPLATILAYDLDPRVPGALSAMAARNGVAKQVHFLGTFGRHSLADQSCSTELIVCDIEGAEVSLLDPVANPGLARCDVLVEVHDAQTGTIEGILKSRFSATHRVRRVLAEGRIHGHLPPSLGRSLSVIRAQELMNEGRCNGLTWLLMQVRGNDNCRQAGSPDDRNHAEAN